MMNLITREKKPGQSRLAAYNTLLSDLCCAGMGINSVTVKETVL